MYTCVCTYENYDSDNTYIYGECINRWSLCTHVLAHGACGMSVLGNTWWHHFCGFRGCCWCCNWGTGAFISFCARAVDLRTICAESNVHIEQKLTRCTSVAQSNQRWSKALTKAPRRTPQSAQGEERVAKGIQRRNKKLYTNTQMIHEKYRSTAIDHIKRPALIYIYIYTYMYMYI